MDENIMSTKKYWNDKAAALEAEVKADKEAAKNLSIDDLRRQLLAKQANPIIFADDINDLEVKIAKMIADKDAIFWVEWTEKVTKARRSEWNARVKSGEFGKMGSGKVNITALRKAEAKQGWNVEQLKKAVKHYGL